MYTYQIQDRYFVIRENSDFEFPSETTIIAYLEPCNNFGKGKNKIDFFLSNQKFDILIDHLSGRFYYKPNKRLAQLKRKFQLDGTTFEINKNELRLDFICEHAREFDIVFNLIYYGIPLFLNVSFPFPVYIKRILGRVGKTEFRWNLKRFKYYTKEYSVEDLLNDVQKSFEYVNIFKNGMNRRYAAAMFYFKVARRLQYSGHMYNEYMSEIVLNYTKILNSLFGESRDDVRDGLKVLGYNENDIEMKFIPYMILRNEFDVGHISLSVLKENELHSLYEYLEFGAEDFRNLLVNVRNKLIDGSFKFVTDLSLNLDKNQQKILDKLIVNFESRIKLKYKDNDKIHEVLAVIH